MASHRIFPSSFSPDARVLAFTQADPQNGLASWELSLDGERKSKPLLQTSASEGGAMFSPDGKWVAYTSDESGRNEVYVQPFSGLSGKWQISTDGGQQPRWARSGKELFYLAEDQQKMMAVDVAIQPTFNTSKPRLVSQASGFSTIAPPGFSDYDVSPDGQHFLRVKVAAWAQQPTQINVVLNWFEELKQKVPTGKK